MVVALDGMCGRTFLGAVLGMVMLLAPGACLGQGYTITTVAGGGNNFPVGGIPATSALVTPIGAAVDAAGNLYIADAGSFVSKVNPAGSIVAYAGGPQKGTGFSGDGGPATSALLYFNSIGPSGLAIDSAGSLYIADTNNNRIRKVSASGVITTVAGGGSAFSQTRGDGGPATQATLFNPTGVAVDSGGNLYIADQLNQRVRKVDPSGTITTVAGCGEGACILTYAKTGSIGDGGPATSGYLNWPTAVALDSAGNLYIADQFNNRIRKVSTSGIITTVAGSGAGSYQGDGGPAISAGLLKPDGVAVDAAGNIYIDDAGDFRIRMVTTDGTITTIAGNGAELPDPPFGTAVASGVPATSTSLSLTYGIALGPGGTIYIADLYGGVRSLTPSGPPGNGSGTPPSITSNGGVVSSSAFGQLISVAPGSWIEIYGANLAADTRGWTSADFNGASAPTTLDGTSVTIGGQSAFLDFISPTEIEAQVPSNVSTGSQPVVVTTAAGASSAYMITVNQQEPGLLAPASYSIGGKQYVDAVFSDGSTFVPPGAEPGTVSRRPRPGETVTLYGIGFGPVTPVIPAGQIAQQSNSLVLPPQISFGQMQATISYAGLALNLVGVYQFDVVVPNVASSDTVPLTFTLGGVAGTQTLYIAVQD